MYIIHIYIYTYIHMCVCVCVCVSDPPEKWFQNHEPAAQLTEVWHCTVAHTHTCRQQPTGCGGCARRDEALCDGRVRLQASGGPR